MNDLERLLTSTHDEIAAATAPVDDRTLRRVHGVVRRGRIQRHAATTFGAVAGVAVLATGGWLAATDDRPDPAPPAGPPTHAATPAPSSDPTTSPTPPAADGPVERTADPSDADVLARLAAPRTGERWLPAEPAPDVAAQLLNPELVDGYDVYLVGDRAASAVYVAVDRATAALEADTLTAVDTLLFEIDEDGPRLVVCPSARLDDPCLDPGPRVDGTDVQIDDDTFYDTLTLPAQVQVGDWTVTTAATRDASPVYGFPYAFGQDAAATYGTFGAVSLVGTPPLHADAPHVAGLTSGAYAWRLPFGSYVPLAATEVPGGDFDAITWDDGVSRPDDGSRALAAGSLRCSSEQLSVEDRHDDAAWRAAGTTSDGLTVHVPVAGGNETSRAVRSFMLERSGTIADDGSTLTGADAGYPYLTDDEFLAANALYAVAAPDGTWHLHVRPDAANVVYESA